VTGGQLSTINGLLKSTVGNANFYFINPAGVTFGANAQLDVPAAFHVTTADTLRFSDGSQFSAIDPTASTLTVAEPSGFGFLSNQGGDIAVQGSLLNFKEGSSVSLSAHNVAMDYGWLVSPSGNIQVNATGDVVTDLPINTPASTNLTGRVDLKAVSWIDTSGNNGGKINIQSGDVSVDEGSLITSDTKGEGNAGSVDIKANRLTVSNTGQISSDTYSQGNAGSITVNTNETVINDGFIYSDALSDSTGNAGTVTINSQKLSVLGLKGQIASDTYSTGHAGNITINSDQTVIDGGSIYSNARSGSTGNAGKITVNTKNLSLLNRGWLKSESVSEGNAGNLEVNADTVSVLSEGQISSSASDTGNAGSILVNSNDTVVDGGLIYSDAKRGGTGNGGSVSINSGNLTLLNGGWISSDSSGSGHAGLVSIVSNYLKIANRGQITSTSLGSGNAGNIVIHSKDSVIDNGLIYTDTNSGSGNGGGVAINSNNVSVLNDGWVSSDSLGIGNGGSVSITSDNLSVSNNARITSSATGAGNAGSLTVNSHNTVLDGGYIYSDAMLNSTGNAGVINIKTDNLKLLNAAYLNSDTAGSGHAGTIKIESNSSVLNNATISSDTHGSGNAGSVILKSNHLSALNSASISSSTFDAGRAGNVTITAPLIALDNANISAKASAQSQGQTGNLTVNANQAIYLANKAGISLKNEATIANTSAIVPSSITVSAADIDLKDSQITTEATGNVDAADINVNFSNTLSMDPSFITTAANTGNGGDISIWGGQLIQLQNSGFLTSVSGAKGNGGNINVTSDYLIMDTGVIQANAVGGSGGDINLDLKALIPSQNRLTLGGRRVDWQPYRSGLNVIQAASENGVSGAINVTSPQFDISASVSGLDSNQLVMPNIDRSLCQSSAMLSSSLSRGGKGGIPVDEAQYGFIPPAVMPSKLSSSAVANPSTLSGESLPCASLQP
jgi:large exoprotein involved in heme utilization and adhesion